MAAAMAVAVTAAVTAAVTISGSWHRLPCSRDVATAYLVECQQLQLQCQVDPPHLDIGGTVSCPGAKPRMDRTPAATSTSATRCAAGSGVAMTPMTTSSRRHTKAASRISDTVIPATGRPIFSGSVSNRARTGKPRAGKPG